MVLFLTFYGWHQWLSTLTYAYYIIWKHFEPFLSSVGGLTALIRCCCPGVNFSQWPLMMHEVSLVFIALFCCRHFISTYYDIWRLLAAFHTPGASRKVDSWRPLSTVQIGFHLVALLCVCGCVQHDFWLAKLVVDCPLRLWSTHWMYYAWFQLLEGQLGNVFCDVLVLCVDGTYKCTKNGRGSYKSSFIYGIHVRHSFHHWKYLS